MTRLDQRGDRSERIDLQELGADIWLRRGLDDGNIVFQGPYNLLDEPRRIRANAFDQTLIVGFETVVVLQDGMPTPVTRAWLRAYN